MVTTPVWLLSGQNSQVFVSLMPLIKPSIFFWFLSVSHPPQVYEFLYLIRGMTQGKPKIATYPAGFTVVLIPKYPIFCSSRFSLNLQCGPGPAPPTDVACHISVRFPEGTVVLNTCQYGNWQAEEVHHRLPFHPGANFQIMIMCGPGSFKVKSDTHLIAVLLTKNIFSKYPIRLLKLILNTHAQD